MDLSIIIVNFNTKDVLKNCIESIYKFTTGIKFEVIVVDNHSIDGSIEMIRSFAKKYSNFKLIENSENVGFGVGNNFGIKKSSGKFILLLNSDTLLLENTLLKSITFMKSHKKCGISTVRLLNQDKTEQATGGSFPTLSKVFLWATFLDDLPIINRMLDSYHPHTNNGYFKSEHQQDWITGAFFMIRRDVLDQIGDFDKDFHMYVEEIELCYRAKCKLWEVWFTPISKIIHFGGGSSPNKINSVLGEFKGLKLFYKKHFPNWQGLILSILLFKAAFLRLILFGIVKGDKNYLKAYSKALLI